MAPIIPNADIHPLREAAFVLLPAVLIDQVYATRGARIANKRTTIAAPSFPTASVPFLSFLAHP